MPGTKMPKSPMLMMHNDMPVMRFAKGGPTGPTLMMNPDMPVMRFAKGDAVVSPNPLSSPMYSPLDLFGITNYGEGIGGSGASSSMPIEEPAQQEDSFDMLKMFMELTPEEKMMVAGPNFNEMTEDEIGMAMYNFISEGRGLSGGREVDYMDPDKQGLAGGGIVSLMDDDY